MAQETSYDYIIVGGGSAGCVLANRLSENGKRRICLLEAGPRDTNPFIKIPGLMLVGLRSKELNWQYKTVPQPHCANREMLWPRGRTLGGSSAINAMCYIRGNAQDYDHWAKLGNPGWSYQEVMPYFKKLENFEPGANAYHGMGGPLNVAGPRYINPLVKAFMTAGQQAGYVINQDFNGATQDGAGYYYVMEKNGSRCSNAHAYLHPVEKRQNLTVITSATVTKILFTGKRATGVRYILRGQSIDINANKEIIISAGTVGSPQLLLLSGVGSRNEIEKHQLSLVHDLPGVGKNLQDHIDIHITHLDKTREAISLHIGTLPRTIVNTFKYIFWSKGEFTSNVAQAGGFLKTTEAESAPDLQWHFTPVIYTRHGQDTRSLKKYYGYTLNTCLLQPLSRGQITLQSSDPFAMPLIHPNYFAEPRDLDKLVAAFKKAREVLMQPAFEPYRLREHEPSRLLPTDEQIRDYIRQRAETIYHPVGTCKMGNDPMAVVDPSLKVHGLTGLRVVDASIMPVIVRGNTNAPVTMIAEKAADMILQDQ